METQFFILLNFTQLANEEPNADKWFPPRQQSVDDYPIAYSLKRIIITLPSVDTRLIRWQFRYCKLQFAITSLGIQLDRNFRQIVILLNDFVLQSHKTLFPLFFAKLAFEIQTKILFALEFNLVNIKRWIHVRFG